MKQSNNPDNKEGALENQSALNKNPSMQNDNNIASHPSKDDLNTPGKEVIEEDTFVVDKNDSLTTRDYKISFFDNVKDIVPKERKLKFEEILKYFKEVATKPFTKKENLEAMICGSFSKPQRASEYLISRSIITYDIDNFKGNFDELLSLVKECFKNNTYIYYTTASSTYDNPRIRLMLFIDGEIQASSYSKITRNIAYELLPEEIRKAIDDSSYSPIQLMFLPCVVNNEFRSGKNIGDLIDGTLYLYEKEGEETLDSLCKELVVYHKSLPLEISREKVEAVLAAYDCSKTSYSSWFTVCQALNHQFRATEEGLEIFTKWSLTDNRYKEEDIIEQCRVKYYSVKGNVANPVTFASVIKVVNEKKEALSNDLSKKIEKLPKYFEEKDVRSIINTLARHFTNIEAEIYLKQIKEKTQWSISNLRNIFKGEQNKIEHEKSKTSTDAYPLYKKLPRGVFIDFHDNRIPKGTYENFSILLEKYGIDIRYNLISKDMDYLIPGVSHTKDNAGEAYYADIISICERNNIKKSNIDSYIIKLGDIKKYNPVLECIESKPWDGISRLNELYHTVTTNPDFPKDLKETLIRKWLISAVAAPQYKKFHSKGVLVFQGQQSLGKTPWFKKLLPHEIEPYFLESGHLDVDSKDSMITAVSKWIVELGEIDSTFKKDIPKLKGFISKGEDIIRRPYQRKNSNYQRRTIFCGTVNDEEFLKDASGNVRFWVIPVVEVNYEHQIDMQQVWAEINQIFKEGERWWLDREEEQKLEFQNRRHLKTLGYEDLIIERYKFTQEINKLYEEAHIINSSKLSEEKKIKNKKNTISLKDLGCEEKTIQEILDVLVPSESKRGWIKEEFRKSLLKLGIKRLSDNKKYLMPPL